MKALSLALALATATAVTAPVALAQSSEPITAERSEHGWRVGDKVPVTYRRFGRYELENPAAFGLLAAPTGYKWMRVDNTAYLVNGNSFQIIMMRTVADA